LSAALNAWVEQIAVHVDAERVHVCVGDEDEMAMLEVAAARRARGEVRTGQEVASIIAARTKEDAGPDNAFLTREAAAHRFWPRLFDSMRRETLYCVPYVLGEPGASWAEPGMMLTDDPRFVLAFASRTRIGAVARSSIEREGARIVRCVHASLAAERRRSASSPRRGRFGRSGSAAKRSSKNECASFAPDIVEPNNLRASCIDLSAGAALPARTIRVVP
jgi:GTP-dependent phosphoenolpyruvate carboxykinase